MARLFELWETELPRLSGKSKLAEAIRYAIARRAALECFLSDGRVEIIPTLLSAPSDRNNYSEECVVRRIRWRW